MNWISIIFDIALPILMKCQQQQSAQTSQEYLTDHYDEATGKMDRSVVKDSIPTVMHATRKAFREATKEDRKTFPKLSRDEIYTLTEQKLIESMNAPPEEVARITALAERMGDVGL